MAETSGKKRKAASRSKPFYSLSEVKQLTRKGAVSFRVNALESARIDFGWKADDMVAAIQQLKHSHFFKSEPSRMIQNCMIDSYKAPDLRGESVYLHFYVVKGRLIINSFKKL
jgi:hypothetical protein